ERAKLRRGSNRGRPGISVHARESFWRQNFGANDDGLRFLDRFDAWRDERCRVFRVPVRADFAEPGENRGGGLSLPWRHKGAKLRRTHLVYQTANRGPGHVGRELVFDVLFDLAPAGDIFIMLIQGFEERVPAGPVRHEIEALAPRGFG